MLYSNNDLPEGSVIKPYIYTNFVTTVDGKVQVKADWKSYWPIGSEIDHKVLTELRAFSDVLIHGSQTAKSFKFVSSIQTPNLEAIRKSRGVSTHLPYIIMSNHPDKDLLDNLKNPKGGKAYLFTNRKARVPKYTEKIVSLVRFNKDKVKLKSIESFLGKHFGAKRILVEGGPSLLGSFLEEDLISEIFLTITPKIFGNEPGKTLSLVEGRLFPSEKIVNLDLISIKKLKSELFLRYKVIN